MSSNSGGGTGGGAVVAAAIASGSSSGTTVMPRHGSGSGANRGGIATLTPPLLDAVTSPLLLLLLRDIRGDLRPGCTGRVYLYLTPSKSASVTSLGGTAATVRTLGLAMADMAADSSAGGGSARGGDKHRAAPLRCC